MPALTGEGSLSDDSPPAKTAKEEEPAICCDKCNEKETPATGYCERCCVKMCIKHFEVRLGKETSLGGWRHPLTTIAIKYHIKFSFHTDF